MQQASCMSGMAAFFNTKIDDKGRRYGYLVEYGTTETIFQNSHEKLTRDYV